MKTLTALVLCAPLRTWVRPLASTLKITPGTVSANSRKLRVICGTDSICCSETIVPTSEVRTSRRRPPLTTISSSSPPAKFSVEVDATLSVTTCSVPAPALTV